MDRKIYRLQFRSGLHLSTGKAENYDTTQSTIHSDTLKSALFVAALELYGEKSDNNSDGVDISFLESFNISSALPWMMYEGKVMYFLPKPIGLFDSLKIPNDLPPKEEKRIKKKWKGIKFMEVSLLNAVLSKGAEPLLQPELKTPSGNAFLVHNTQKEPEKAFAQEVQQHVAIPRMIDPAEKATLSKDDQEKWFTDSRPYTVDKLYFNHHAGLYILAESENFDKLEAALELLSDSGLGTDKNNGAGDFTFVKSDAFDWSVEGANAQMNISLYCPEDGDLSSSDLLRYQLIKRGGYIANPGNNVHLSIRKKSIYMFSEGSVFPFDESQIGRIADLQPEDKPLNDSDIPRVGHPIYRDGRAIFLPINIKVSEV